MAFSSVSSSWVVNCLGRSASSSVRSWPTETTLPPSRPLKSTGSGSTTIRYVAVRSRQDFIILPRMSTPTSSMVVWWLPPTGCRWRRSVSTWSVSMPVATCCIAALLFIARLSPSTLQLAKKMSTTRRRCACRAVPTCRSCQAAMRCLPTTATTGKN